MFLTLHGRYMDGRLKIYNSMFKPAILLNGQNIPDRKTLKEIGFKYSKIGN